MHSILNAEVEKVEEQRWMPSCDSVVKKQQTSSNRRLSAAEIWYLDRNNAVSFSSSNIARSPSPPSLVDRARIDTPVAVQLQTSICKKEGLFGSREVRAKTGKEMDGQWEAGWDY